MEAGGKWHSVSLYLCREKKRFSFFDHRLKIELTKLKLAKRHCSGTRRKRWSCDQLVHVFEELQYNYAIITILEMLLHLHMARTERYFIPGFNSE